MVSETVDPIDWSHPPPSWAVTPELHVFHGVNEDYKSQDFLHQPRLELPSTGMPDKRTTCAATRGITRTCLNSPDSFCDICGSFTIPSQRTNINTFVKQTYSAYFIKIEIKGRPGSLTRCISNVSRVYWYEPREHVMSCHSVYLWFGESKKIISHTFTFVQWKLHVITRKLIEKYDILLYHQQCVQCLI